MVLIILLFISLIINIVLIFKVDEISSRKLGEISSLNIMIAKKDKEIISLKKEIKDIKILKMEPEV